MYACKKGPITKYVYMVSATNTSDSSVTVWRNSGHSAALFLKHIPLRALYFNIYSFSQQLHTTVIKFTTVCSETFQLLHVSDHAGTLSVSTLLLLTFIAPCIVIYSCSKTNKMHLFLKLFILVKHSTSFGRSFRPSPGAQDCTYSNRHMSNSCCYLLLAGTKWN
jgi:hypothetical protein